MPLPSPLRRGRNVAPEAGRNRFEEANPPAHRGGNGPRTGGRRRQSWLTSPLPEGALSLLVMGVSSWLVPLVMLGELALLEPCGIG